MFGDGRFGILSRFAGVALALFGSLLRDLQLGDALFPFIQLPVEDADLADVAGFEADDLIAEMFQLQLSVGEKRADGGEDAALVGEFDFLRRGLAEDCGGHL